MTTDTTQQEGTDDQATVTTATETEMKDTRDIGMSVMICTTSMSVIKLVLLGL